MASQRFCLRWNNHQSNMLSVFDQLLHAETFTDVTLAVEGQLLKAHKMVLSACSPYFQALFVNHQEKHPIVILKDVPYSDMKSLLDFMYRGEVSVDQERLTAFLKVAESLRIKGLTEVNEEKCDIPALTNSLIQQQQTNVSAHTPPPQLHRLHSYMSQKRPNSGIPSGGAPPNLLMPLLGNALTQPKRKRGRPRKLSGSSSDALNTAASPPGEFVPETAAHAQSNRAGEPIIRGSPEMLEVKMSMDGFGGDDGATSGGEEGGEALLIDEGEDAQSNEGPHKDSESTDLMFSYHGVVGDSTTPIITLELISESSTETNATRKLKDEQLDTAKVKTESNVAEPCLLTKKNNDNSEGKSEMGDHEQDTKSRHDFMEYLTRSDGSVVCKLCGEVLQSRTHWYRHKYKLHVIPPLNPAPLYQCDQCLVFFKSRKGYIGHLASRHSEMLSDANPVLTNTHADTSAKEALQGRLKEETVNKDPELPTAPETLPTLMATATTTKQAVKVGMEARRPLRSSRAVEHQADKGDGDERRSREEIMVASIIDRVRRECEQAEAQGSGGPARRGYTRRTTVMHT